MAPRRAAIFSMVPFEAYSGENVVWCAPQVATFSRSAKRMSSVCEGKLKIMSTLSESKHGAASPMRSRISAPLPYFR